LCIDPDKALVISELETAVITDPHFGKEASFQTAGLPVPSPGLAADLHRLSSLLNRHQTKRLLILGDFFHNAHSRSSFVEKQLLQWRDAHSALEILMIRGNHDRHAGDPEASLSIRVLEGPHQLDGLILCHEPPDQNGKATPSLPILAGHVHPAVLLKDRAGRGLRLPCFHFAANGLGLLPSFGSFTGHHIVRPVPGDRIIAAHQGQAVEIPVG
jgi:DNA ligase-associated metallophosphoesterase